MSNQKFIQQQMSVLQAGTRAHTLRCKWLDDEVVLAQLPNGRMRVICDQHKNGFCEYEERTCYVFERATEDSDLEHARQRERETQQAWEVAQVAALVGDDDDNDDGYDEDEDDYDDEDDDDDDS